MAQLWRISDGALMGGSWPWTYGKADGLIILNVPDVTTAGNTDHTIAAMAGDGGRNNSTLQSSSIRRTRSTIWVHFAVPDHDGRSNLLGFALASSPNDPGSGPQITPPFVGDPSHLRITFRIRNDADGFNVTAQMTSDLSDPDSQQPLKPLSIDSQGDTILLVTFEAPHPSDASGPRFVRVKVTVP